MGYFLGDGVPFWYTNPQYKGVGYPEWYTIRDYMGCRGDFNTPQKYTIIQKKTIKIGIDTKIAAAEKSGQLRL